MLLNVAWLVTPFVGVWIETLMTSLIDLENSVTPFVGVWIETDGISNFTPKPKSHPSWVCGLKPVVGRHGITLVGSHPSWVCGLKLNNPIRNTQSITSHPSWVCGLKQPYQ